MTIIKEYKDYQFSISHYHFEFDYSTERDCEAYGCDSICRCSKIIDAKVDRTCTLTPAIVSIEKRSPTKNNRKGQWHKYKLTEIEEYCIARLFHSHDLYWHRDYEVLTSHGYYGEEIVGVDNPNLFTFFNDLHDMINFELDIDKVKLTLLREYEMILPDIERCTKVEINDRDISLLIKCGSTEDRLLTMKRSDFSEYNVTSGQPIGLLFHDRLIDGHHRIAAAVRAKLTTAKFLEVS